MIFLQMRKIRLNSPGVNSLALGLVLVILPLLWPVAAQNGSDSNTSENAGDLLQQMRGRDPHIDIRWDNTTGRLSRLKGLLSGPMQGDEQQVVLDFFAAHQSLLNMEDASKELSIIRVTPGHHPGWKHVKIQQIYKTLKVEGSELVLSIDDQRQVRMVNCRNYVSQIELETAAVIKKADALSMARFAIDVIRLAENEEPTATRLVYPYGGQIHLAWKVQIQAMEPLGNFIYYIDAHTGAIINHYNDMKSVLVRNVYDAGTTTTLRRTLVRADGAGAVGAPNQHVDKNYDWIGESHKYFADKHGRDSWDGGGSTIHSTVNYDVALDNAVWTGSEMYYGAGDGVSTTHYGNALDVVAHELAHGVTGTTSRLIYQNASGALNESVSDIFGVLAERYEGSSLDWEIGEDVSLGGGNIRNFADPPLRWQPDHMRDYVYPNAGGSALDQSCNAAPGQDNGCVHYNSGIPNKAAYLMMVGGYHNGVSVQPIDATLTTAQDEVGKIFYLASTTYLTNSSDFHAAKLATEDAAADLFPGNTNKHKTVSLAWHAVGVLIPTVVASSSSDNVLAALPTVIPFGGELLAVLLMLSCGSYASMKRSRHLSNLSTDAEFNL